MSGGAARRAIRTVTFLGRSALVGREAGAAYVARRAGKWPTHWRVLTGMNGSEALGVLREPGTLGAGHTEYHHHHHHHRHCKRRFPVSFHSVYALTRRRRSRRRFS